MINMISCAILLSIGWILLCILIFHIHYWNLCLYCQEAIESVDPDTVLNVDMHSKLHVLYGGTKVVQHTPPSKTGPGLKGIELYCSVCGNSTYFPSLRDQSTFNISHWKNMFILGCIAVKHFDRDQSQN